MNTQHRPFTECKAVLIGPFNIVSIYILQLEKKQPTASDEMDISKYLNSPRFTKEAYNKHVCATGRKVYFTFYEILPWCMYKTAMP